jgi:hypothetical protein
LPGDRRTIEQDGLADKVVEGRAEVVNNHR